MKWILVLQVSILMVSMAVVVDVDGQFNVFNPLASSSVGPPKLPPPSADAFPGDIDERLSQLESQLHHIGGAAASADAITRSVDNALNFDVGAPPQVPSQSSIFQPPALDRVPQRLPVNVVSDISRAEHLKSKYMKEALAAKSQRDAALSETKRILGVASQYRSGQPIVVPPPSVSLNVQNRGGTPPPPSPPPSSSSLSSVTRTDTEYNRNGCKKRKSKMKVNIARDDEGGCVQKSTQSPQLPPNLQPPNIPAFPDSNGLDRAVNNMLTAQVSYPNQVRRGGKSGAVPLAQMTNRNGRSDDMHKQRSAVKGHAGGSKWIHPGEVDRGLVEHPNDMVVLPQHSSLEYRTGDTEVDTNDAHQPTKSVVSSTEGAAGKPPGPKAISASATTEASPAHNAKDKKSKSGKASAPPPPVAKQQPKGGVTKKQPKGGVKPPSPSTPTPVPQSAKTRFREKRTDEPSALEEAMAQRDDALAHMRNATNVISGLLSRIREIEASTKNEKPPTPVAPKLLKTDGSVNIDEVLAAEKDIEDIRHTLQEDSGKNTAAKLTVENTQLKQGVGDAVSRIRQLVTKLDSVATDKVMLLNEKEQLMKERDLALRQVRAAQAQMSKLLKLMDATRTHYLNKAKTMAKSKEPSQQLDAQAAQAAVNQVQKAHDVIAASSSQISSVAKQLEDAEHSDSSNVKADREKMEAEMANKEKAMKKVNDAAGVIQGLLTKLHKNSASSQMRFREVRSSALSSSSSSLPPPHGVQAEEVTSIDNMDVAPSVYTTPITSGDPDPHYVTPDTPGYGGRTGMASTHHHREHWEMANGKRIEKNSVTSRHHQPANHGRGALNVAVKKSNSVVHHPTRKPHDKGTKNLKNMLMRHFMKPTDGPSKARGEKHRHVRNRNPHQKPSDLLEDWLRDWQRDWSSVGGHHSNHVKHVMRKASAAEKVVSIARRAANDPVSKFIHLLDELGVVPVTTSGPASSSAPCTCEKTVVVGSSPSVNAPPCGCAEGAVMGLGNAAGSAHDFLPMRVAVTPKRRLHVQSSAINAAKAILKKLKSTEDDLLLAQKSRDVNAALDAHLASGRAGLKLLKRIKQFVHSMEQTGMQNDKQGRSLRALVDDLELASQRAVSVSISAHRERLMADIAKSYSVIADLEELSAHAHTDAEKQAVETKAHVAMLMLQDINKRQRMLHAHGHDLTPFM